MTKEEIIKVLSEDYGIEANMSMGKPELEELLAEAKAETEAAASDAHDSDSADADLDDVSNNDPDLGGDDSEDEDDSDEEETESEELEEGQAKVELKLRRRHPRHQFRVGSIVVEGYTFKEYVVDVEILKELCSVGGKHWIAIKEVESEEDYKELEEELTEE